MTVLFSLSAAGYAAAETIPPKSTVKARVPMADATVIQQRRDVLFKAMLAKPDDLDVAFEYAALSAQVGDLEAAISTLERMLIFAPGLPRLQLELGVLYYRLNAFETARSYFQSALSAPDVPPEVRSKVEQYLAGIDDAAKPERFTGQMRAGIRYQTNANRAPTDSTILLNGVPFSLDSSSQASPDGNVYAAGAFHMSYALPSQGDTIEADLITYVSEQFKRHDLDVALAELSIGPAFDMGRFGIDNAALGVYVIGAGVVLDGNFYSATIGAGTRFLMRPTPATSFMTALEYRHRDYHDSSSSPTASYRDGDEVRALGTVTHILSPSLAIGANAYVQNAWAARDYLAYVEGGFSVGPRFAFASPVSKDMPAWTAAINVGAVFRDYDAADLAISTEAESDREVFIGGGLTVPLKSNFALIADMEYRNVSSNYDTRNYDNFSIALSLAKSF